MRSSLKAVALGLAVALLCVPAAFAKGPGGHGGGKPSWAGGSSAGTHSHGKPSWAGQGKGHADKAKTKHAKHQKAETDADAADEASGDGELNLGDLNPAWACFTLEAIMDAQDMEDAEAADVGEAAGPSSFEAEFGTNDNKANSHGKCVSAAAQGEDVSAALGDDEQSCDESSGDEQGEDSGEQADEDSSDDTASDDSSGDDTSGDDTSSDEDAADEDSGDDTSSDDGSADEDSGDQADASDECQQDDGSGEEPSADEGDSADDDQGEESDAQSDEDDQNDEAAFARALLRYVHL